LLFALFSVVGHFIYYWLCGVGGIEEFRQRRTSFLLSTREGASASGRFTGYLFYSFVVALIPISLAIDVPLHRVLLAVYNEFLSEFRAVVILSWPVFIFLLLYCGIF